MGILFTILMGFLLTITMGILFTIVPGIQFTISRRTGLYSKVILTVIAASLVGLLAKELPRKVEAKPERENKAREVFFLELHPAGREDALLHTVAGDTYTRLKDARGDIQVNAILRSLYSENPASSRRYRVKFVTNDFIILESE